MAEWVVGLSIDEDISLGAARIGAGGKLEQSKMIIKTLLTSEEAIATKDWETALRRRLDEYKLAPNSKDIFQNTAAVGVSSIGLVNRKLKRLSAIARKNRVDEINERNEKNCIVDFGRLFDGLVPPQAPINVHNDATANCVLQYDRQSSHDRARTLLNVMISEGVNGGIVVDGFPPATELHPEIGHIWPQLHPVDYDFNPKNTGCPIHTRCYEGVASGARIRKCWSGDALEDLGWDYPDNRDHPWHVMAYYIGQLCNAATAIISPERIVISGPVIFSELLPHIRNYFKFFNSGGSGKNYPKYETMRLDGAEDEYKDFIRMGLTRKNDGVWGALELGRLAAMHHGAPALRLSPSQRIPLRDVSGSGSPTGGLSS